MRRILPLLQASLLLAILFPTGCGSGQRQPAPASAERSTELTATVDRRFGDWDGEKEWRNRSGRDDDPVADLFARRLEITVPTAADADRIRSWQTGETGPCMKQIWDSHRGLREALEFYCWSHDGAWPTAVQDVAPYCFSWPVKGPRSTELIPLVDAETFKVRVAQHDKLVFPLEQMLELQMLALDLTEDGASVYRPAIETGGTRCLFMGVPEACSRYPGSTPRYRRESITTLASLPPDALRTRLSKAFNWAPPEEIRVGFAADALQELIRWACLNLWRPPENLDEMLQFSGHQVINLAAVPPEEADILVEFDGESSYRMTLRYMPNLVVQRIYTIHRVAHPHFSASIIGPTRFEELRPEASFVPFASFRLATPSAAAMPYQLSPPGGS